jgi:hypothetical protein
VNNLGLKCLMELLDYLMEYVNICTDMQVVIAADELISSYIGMYSRCDKLLIMRPDEIIGDFLNEYPQVYGNCALIISSVVPESDYDVELIVKLYPKYIVALYDATGTTGSVIFHNTIRYVAPSAVFYGMWRLLSDPHMFHAQLYRIMPQYMCKSISRCVLENNYTMKHFAICAMIRVLSIGSEMLSKFNVLPSGDLSCAKFGYLNRLRVYYLNLVRSSIRRTGISSHTFRQFLYQHNVCTDADDYCRYIVDINTPYYVSTITRVGIPNEFNYAGKFTDKLLSTIDSVLECHVKCYRYTSITICDIITKHCNYDSCVWISIKMIPSGSITVDTIFTKWHIMSPLYDGAGPINMCVVALLGPTIRVLDDQTGGREILDKIIEESSGLPDSEVYWRLSAALDAAKLREVGPARCMEVVCGDNGTIFSYMPTLSDCIYLYLVCAEREIIESIARFHNQLFVVDQAQETD